MRNSSHVELRKRRFTTQYLSNQNYLSNPELKHLKILTWECKSRFGSNPRSNPKHKKNWILTGFVLEIAK